jgi:hypothetical protein
VKPPSLYSVDTSALIDGLERFYPEETFPALWKEVNGLVSTGRLLISEEVWQEARVRDAAAKAWCDGHKDDGLIVPTDATIVREVRNILSSFPNLVKQSKNRNRADAFVIAVARLKGAIVVTGEGPDGNERQPKIPYICQQLGVTSIRFLGLIRLEGWKF